MVRQALALSLVEGSTMAQGNAGEKAKDYYFQGMGSVQLVGIDKDALTHPFGEDQHANSLEC